MTIRKSFGGIELTPDNQAEADAFELLFLNVRFETHQQFFDRIVSKWPGKRTGNGAGEDLNHEKGTATVAERHEIPPNVFVHPFGS